MQAEADTLAKLCSINYVKDAYKNVFSEELDVVTLVHGDLWSSNMMFRVTQQPCAKKYGVLHAHRCSCSKMRDIHTLNSLYFQRVVQPRNAHVRSSISKGK